MLDENKVIADLRQFVGVRVARGQVLDVDEIGLMFLCVSEAAQGEAYEDVSAANIEPFVKIVIAEYLRGNGTEMWKLIS